MGKAQAENTAEIVINMYRNHFTLEQIALATKKDIEEIQAVIDKKKPVMV